MNKLFTIILVLLFYSSAFAENIIFQTNFDSCDDWSITQGVGDISNIFPTYTEGNTDFPSDHPASGSNARYVGWFESRTFLSPDPHDTVNLSSTNSRSDGKAITHWTEVASTTPGGDASDGTLYISLTDTVGDATGYPEIWITQWRKYDASTPYYTSQNVQKYLHASHYDGVGGLTNWFDNTHIPSIVGGTQGDNSTDGSGNKLRWHYYMVNLYPAVDRNNYTWTSGDLDCGTYQAGTGTKTIQVKGILSSGTDEGGWQENGNYGDGNWYAHEWHLKMNSSPGTEDGMFEYYIDRRCQLSINNIPFIKSGGTMVGWNMVVLGGNNDYHNGGGAGYDTWYAYDDVVISVDRINLAGKSNSAFQGASF